MGSHEFVLKAKYCIETVHRIMVIKSTSNSIKDIIKANQLLKSLQKDGKALLAHANRQKREFEKKEAQCLEIISDFKRTKQRYERKKRNLRGEKTKLNEEHKYLKAVLVAARSQKRKTQDSLKHAKSRLRHEKEKEKKRIKTGRAIGGALLGKFGANAGVVLAKLVNDVEGDANRAERDIEQCQREVRKAQRNLQSKQKALKSLEETIKSCNKSIRYYTKKANDVQAKIRTIKNTLVIMDDAIVLWELFGSVSGSRHTDVLPQIVAIIEKKKKYEFLRPDGMKTQTGTFLEAWEASIIEL